MKKTALILLIITICLLVPTGCKKDPPPAEPPLFFQEADPHPIVMSLGSDIAIGAGAKIFGGILDGITGEIGSEITGWAIGALGICSDTENTTPTSDQIDKIIAGIEILHEDLADIKNELDDINISVNKLREDQAFAPVLDLFGLIDYYYNDYKSFLGLAKSQHIPDSAMLTDWANGIIVGPNSLKAQLFKLSHDLVSSLTDGAISIYLNNNDGNKPIEGTFSDIAYYNSIEYLREYLYNYQAIGILLVTEAHNYKAFNTVKDTAASVHFLASNDFRDLKYIAGSRIQMQLSLDFVNSMYENLVKQFKAIGAPLTNDKIVLYNSQTNPTLWVRSLEEYTTAAGENYEYPLTSAKPLGITVGRYNEGFSMNFNFGGFRDWRPAKLDDMIRLTANYNFTNNKLFLYMEEMGLVNAEHKIIISNFKVKGKLFSDQTVEENYVPFLDGSLIYEQPVYTTERYLKLMRSRARTRSYGGSIVYYTDFFASLNVPENRNGFYDIKSIFTRVGNRAPTYAVGQYPGWNTQADDIRGRQYRWPVISVLDYPNSPYSPTHNAAGVLSLFGTPFYNWLKKYLPKPPLEV